MMFGTTVPLPMPPPGWFEYGYAVLSDGSLGLLRTQTDVHAAFVEAPSRAEAAAPPRLLGGRARLSVFDGSAERDAIEVPLDGHVDFDRLVDGRWLVVSASAADGEKNARAYTAGGTAAGAFRLGVGVEHVRCAPDGSIWIGYHDEGVFAESTEDGSWRISSAGVARFSSDGSELWRFRTRENGGSREGVRIHDCYALTLAGDAAWFYPYSDFPIVRVERGTVRHWRNDVAGAKALAVDGDNVVLAGGYGDEERRIVLLRLGREGAERIGQTYIPAERSRAHLLAGRGPVLHLAGGGTWTRFDVATVRSMVDD